MGLLITTTLRRLFTAALVLGIILPGTRLPAVAANRVLFRDGEPVAVKERGRVRFLTELDSAAQWEAANALERRKPPPALRAYLGR